MTSFRNLRKLVLIILIPALCWLFYNQVANWHYARLPNGLMIEHSHPYNKHTASSHSPIPNHSHTKSELLHLDIISHFFVLLITAFLLRQLIRTFTTTPVPIHVRIIIKAEYGLVKDSRAPPA